MIWAWSPPQAQLGKRVPQENDTGKRAHSGDRAYGHPQQNISQPIAPFDAAGDGAELPPEPRGLDLGGCGKVTVE